MAETLFYYFFPRGIFCLFVYEYPFYFSCYLNDLRVCQIIQTKKHVYIFTSSGHSSNKTVNSRLLSPFSNTMLLLSYVNGRWNKNTWSFALQWNTRCNNYWMIQTENQWKKNPLNINNYIFKKYKYLNNKGLTTDTKS